MFTTKYLMNLMNCFEFYFTSQTARVSPVKVWVSTGLPQGQGFWVQQNWVWQKPSWRRSPLTPL